MQRTPEDLTRRVFDLAIIGGGITGCCIARDAARRGLRVALVERDDFSSGTSAATSRLIHGGLRYLKQLQVGVVRESLRERAIWGRIARGAVRASPFLLPTFGWRDATLMRLALTAYDALSFDRNRGAAPGHRIPRSRRVSRAALIEREEILGSTRATGGFTYADTITDAPERLALACIRDALDHGAVCINHAAAHALRRGKPHVLTVRDSISGAMIDVSARCVVNAAGPWADGVSTFLGDARPARITRSKGIHVITRALTSEHALLVPIEGRHFFVIPWQRWSLIGTTDTPYPGDPDDVGVSIAEIEDIVNVVNRAIPGAGLRPDEARYAYAGLRPLVSVDGSTYTASRRSEIHVDADDVVTVLGGKWTTSRALAEQTVTRVAARLGASSRSCDTHVAPLPWSAAAIPDHHAANDAAISRSVKEEMAVNLTDVLFRRTHFAIIASLESTGSALRDRVRVWADVMARLRGWSPAERELQLNDVFTRYRRVSMWPA